MVTFKLILKTLFSVVVLIPLLTSPVVAGGDEGALIVGNLNGGFDGNGILRYQASSGEFIDMMVPEGTGGVTGCCCMDFGPDENLYVSSVFTGEVYRFNGVTGEFIDVFVPAGSGGLVIPLVTKFGPDGNLYVGGYRDQQPNRPL